MSKGNVPFDQEAFLREKVESGQYGRGIRDENSGAAVEARQEHRARQTYDDNDATAPGEFCELCGSLITAGQQTRRRPDGWWIHEACPMQ